MFTIIKCTWYVLPTVPPPTITITGSPQDEGFHIGLLLTFTGRAEFNLAVDIPLNVSSAWSKTTPSSDLSNANITTAVQVMENPTVYETNLTLHLLDTEGDSGNYIITFITSSSSFTAGTTDTYSRPITVMCEYGYHYTHIHACMHACRNARTHAHTHISGMISSSSLLFPTTCMRSSPCSGY